MAAVFASSPAALSVRGATATRQEAIGRQLRKYQQIRETVSFAALACHTSSAQHVAGLVVMEAIPTSSVDMNLVESAVLTRGVPSPSGRGALPWPAKGNGFSITVVIRKDQTHGPLARKELATLPDRTSSMRLRISSAQAASTSGSAASSRLIHDLRRKRPQRSAWGRLRNPCQEVSLAI